MLFSQLISFKAHAMQLCGVYSVVFGSIKWYMLPRRQIHIIHFHASEHTMASILINSCMIRCSKYTFHKIASYSSMPNTHFFRQSFFHSFFPILLVWIGIIWLACGIFSHFIGNFVDVRPIFFFHHTHKRCISIRSRFFNNNEKKTQAHTQFCSCLRSGYTLQLNQLKTTSNTMSTQFICTHIKHFPLVSFDKVNAFLTLLPRICIECI